MGADETETHASPKQRRDTRRASLVIVLQGRKPSARPVRIRIDPGVDVDLGRGTELSVAQSDGVLRIEIPDSLMSSKHARIATVLGRPTLTDAGSKNGTRVGWQPKQNAVLQDGDWI